MNNWFQDARFGMFIHYGAYAAAGRGEWIYNREKMTPNEYREQCIDQFKAENYDPLKWAQLAKEAGMKYVILTTKHHDGFCLWDTETTDYNAVHLGPKNDLVKEFVQAVRTVGLKVGFYYSPADWHLQDYPDSYARDWPTKWEDEEARKRFIRFYTSQLEELMIHYGKIDLLWYDGCIPGPIDGKKVNERIKSLQPDIVINNRNGEPFDFVCCEQCIRAPKEDIPWEACMTLNENWGYHKGDTEYKTAKAVICSLIKTAKDGGNLLLNVGPKEDGTIPEQSVKILQEVGKWVSKHQDAIYGTRRSPFSWGTSQELAVKGNKVYIYSYYNVSELHITEIANRINRIYRLRDDKHMDFYQDEIGRLTIYQTEPDECVEVFVCEVEGEPKAITPQTSFWIPG